MYQQDDLSLIASECFLGFISPKDNLPVTAKLHQDAIYDNHEGNSSCLVQVRSMANRMSNHTFFFFLNFSKKLLELFHEKNKIIYIKIPILQIDIIKNKIAKLTPRDRKIYDQSIRTIYNHNHIHMQKCHPNKLIDYPIINVKLSWNKDRF